MPSTSHRLDVLVVGGGPAGIAAAVSAAECGATVGLVDDNVAVGGQIWRGEDQKTTVPESREWFNKLRSSSVQWIPQARVFHQPAPGTLLAETPSGVIELQYSSLVLATGARERFLPFPGWTLPNVIGAGGLQALVKSGLPIAGKSIVVAGSGPLLLAVASYLRKHGAEIRLIAEQASMSSLFRFGVKLLRQPGKLVQAVQLKRDLHGARFVPNSWPTAAHGRDKVESVTLSVDGKLETIPCDYLASGFHLVPNTELASLLGCELKRGFVTVGDAQATSVASVFCAGEPTGIGGLELSLIEGQIAGFAAAGHRAAAELLQKRDKLKYFVDLLDETFKLRSELRTLVKPETIVCRCEDVRMEQMRSYTSWRAAKLQTRCGMGPCQGRVCGPATEFLFKWRPDSVRPPIFPTRLEVLAATPGPCQTVTGGQQ
jgi:D-hydroxyproline dehydrogenase subunit alpha